MTTATVDINIQMAYERKQSVHVPLPLNALFNIYCLAAACLYCLIYSKSIISVVLSQQQCAILLVTGVHRIE